MSVDGHLIADVQRLRQVGGKSLFLLVVGGKGAGKSTALHSFASGLSATVNARHATTVQGILNTPASASSGDGFTIWTLTYAGVAHSKSFMPLPNARVSPFSSYSIIVADDIDLLWSLCSINGLLPTLQRILQSVLTGCACALVGSAPSRDMIPAWLLAQKMPVPYPLQDLTEAGMRRFLRSVPKPWFKSHGELLIGAHTICASRQRFLFNVCMSLEASTDGATEAKRRSLAKEDSAFLLHHRFPTSAAQSPTHLYGLEDVRHRINTLISVFTAQRRPGGCGQLIASLPASTGLLFHGPSGCGKSTLARQTASEFPSVPFYFVECTMLFSKYLGESEEKLREVYRRARARIPAVVVLEDLDVIAQSRGAMQSGDGDKGGGRGQLDVTRRMLAGLLCELDGVTDNSGVLTIGITNAPHVLDAAVLRQGRLETPVFIPPLTRDAAEELCSDFFQKFKGGEVQKRECVLLIADHAVGCTAASLQYLLRKVFEGGAQRHGWEAASAGFLPLPTTAEIRGYIFENCCMLQRVEYLHFE